MRTIEEANTVILPNIEGWVGDGIWSICEFLRRDHLSNGVVGSIAEIGVHHGKLFFLLSHIGDENSQLIAIDLFEDQEKNVDSSGSGNRQIFEKHLSTYFPYLKNRVRIVSGDSMAFVPSAVQEVFREKVRIFSVDGGHTVQHVINDMSLAQDVLAPRGTILLDDFFGPHWPSVTEGFFQFMSRHNRRLAPYLIFQNKLFLTTYSEHEQVLQGLHQFLLEQLGDGFGDGRWRYTSVCGHKVLSGV
jgi:hypothetical protein